MDPLSKTNGKDHDDDWSRQEEYVLHELRTISSDFKEHIAYDATNFKELQTSITELKTKIATWGAVIAGAAAVAQPVLSRAAELLLGK